jgi:hypothetical protein
MRRAGSERGSILVVAMVAIAAVLVVGGLTILSVQSSLRTAGADRFQTVALYAAESGAWAGVDFLRDNCDVATLFSAFVPDENGVAQSPPGIYGNGVPPGEPQNPFDPSLQAWYEVSILNNTGDAGQQRSPPVDTDSQVILRVVGHGPGQTQTTIEVEIKNEACLTRYCDTGYAQRGITAQNTSGFAEDDPCAQNVDASEQTRMIDP